MGESPMSEPIKVGDLVMVVRDCCGKYLGEIFTAQDLPSRADHAFCDFCKLDHSAPFFANYGGSHRGARPLPWLKRIPPLSELEGVLAQGEIKHPISGKVLS